MMPNGEAQPQPLCGTVSLFIYLYFWLSVAATRLVEALNAEVLSFCQHNYCAAD
jgi:hypothetical protein